MTRYAWIVLALAACGSKQRPARMFAHGGGECPDPKGCSATIDDQQHYALPDDERPGPPDGTVEPVPAPKPEQERVATCMDVGENLASIELGNYAEETQRASLVTRYAKQCGKAKLDAAERLCAYDATDKPTITWCAPRFMPGPVVPVVEAKGCTAILETMQAQLKLQQPQQEQGLALRQLAAIADSCTNDRWTVTFGDCIRNIGMPAYATAYCGQAAPVPLRKKLDERIAKVK